MEGAFALVSRIYQKQLLPTPGCGAASDDDGIRVYRIPHGVQGVFKDVLLCGESFVPQPLQTTMDDSQHKHKDGDDCNSSNSSGLCEEPCRPKLYGSRVLGPSGDDAEDVVCDSCMLPELEVGDWLVFDRMGAYTLSIASRAGRPVMRYVMGGEAQAG